MKKQNNRIFSLLVALVMCLSLLPATALAADTSGLQGLIDNAKAGDTVKLAQNYTLTETVKIDKALTLDGDGHSITNNSAKAVVLSVDTNSTVEIKNLTLSAGATDGNGIDLTTNSPHVLLTNSTVKASSRGIRSMSDTTANAVLTLDASHILNPRVANGDYANNTTTGDTRGIGLYGVTDSEITLKNSSSIKGFGYSINMSADTVNGVRAGGNTYTITDSAIWGWTAFNIWTVGNTFNITNSDLRGINPLTTDWNSFSTIVLNNNIYGSNPEANQVVPNKFHISGGSISAIKTTDSQYVNQTLFRLDDQAYSEFCFEDYDFEPVVLFCSEPFSAFAGNAYSGLTEKKLEKWAASGKLVLGEDAVVYNWGLLAPGVEVPTVAAARNFNDIEVSGIASAAHEGGDCL